MEESELKTFISGLLARGILLDRGSSGAESFRVGEVDIYDNEDALNINSEASSTNSNSSNLSNSSLMNLLITSFMKLSQIV